MSKFKPGNRTLKNLEGVHPKIVEAVLLAFEYTTQDFCVLDGGGVRSVAAAADNARSGVGVANSLHIVQPDGYGHAVDLVSWQDGEPSWVRSNYDEITKAMYRACDELKLLIQHGADWDMDGVSGEPGEWDWPHWQLPRPGPRLAIAAIAAARRRGVVRAVGK